MAFPLSIFHRRIPGFIRSTQKIVNATKQIGGYEVNPRVSFTTSTLNRGRFQSSPLIANEDDIKQYPEVEVIKNPPEWKYVERLLPQEFIPKPTLKKEYPSGWRPPQPSKELPYYIARTSSYMVPVYLKVTHRGERRVTVVRRIEGDIWALEADLRKVVEKEKGRVCSSRVNELSGQIFFHGDYVIPLRNYLMEKGF